MQQEPPDALPGKLFGGLLIEKCFKKRRFECKQVADDRRQFVFRRRGDGVCEVDEEKLPLRRHQHVVGGQVAVNEPTGKGGEIRKIVRMFASERFREEAPAIVGAGGAPYLRFSLRRRQGVEPIDERADFARRIPFFPDAERVADISERNALDPAQDEVAEELAVFNGPRRNDFGNRDAVLRGIAKSGQLGFEVGPEIHSRFGRSVDFDDICAGTEHGIGSGAAGLQRSERQMFALKQATGKRREAFGRTEHPAPRRPAVKRIWKKFVHEGNIARQAPKGK